MAPSSLAEARALLLSPLGPVARAGSNRDSRRSHSPSSIWQYSHWPSRAVSPSGHCRANAADAAAT